MKTNKFVSAVIAAAMLFASFGSVFAVSDVHPTVTVDDRAIHFPDQEPVISDRDDTLIPVRGVLEAMGATVEWNGENRTVYVKAKDNITRILFTLDDPVATKYTLKTVTVVDNEPITLSTAPTLLNERTMVPLRVIGENFGADVDWDQETKHITIKTKEYKKFMESKIAGGEDAEYDAEKYLPKLYLKADDTAVEKDGEITFDLILENSGLAQGYDYITGLNATVRYDSNEMEYVSSSVYLNGEKADPALDAANPQFLGDSVKYIYLTIADINADPTFTDGKVASFTFKSLNGAKTSVSLSDRLTQRGFDTAVLLVNKERKSKTLSDATQIVIDTEPITLNN